MHSSQCRAVGRSENLGGSSNLMGMISPTPLTEIGLTNLSKSVGAMVPPTPTDLRVVRLRATVYVQTLKVFLRMLLLLLRYA